jgi:NAD(P)-dependent dehydrogenase (short-subunit alcohol dehydrogenase family)
MRREWAGLALAGGLGLLAIKQRARSQPPFDFRGRVVAITGGSRGLGLILARQFAAEGAKLALLARDPATLDRARAELVASGAEVLALPCDVGDRRAIEAAIEVIVSHYGQLDVLVNNAGLIQAGPLAAMTLDDFEQALAVHFWGPLYATYAVIPTMQRQGGGRIVNIASVGGRVAVPHLAPYSASKFALVGLSDALRAELAQEGIMVTTVSPGLMRTGSPRNASFKGRHREEYRWFAILDALPFTSIAADTAARQIVEACRSGTSELTISWQARAAALANTLAPRLTARLISGTNRILPGIDPHGDNSARPGRESESALAPSALTRLSDAAAQANNEVGERSAMG